MTEDLYADERRLVALCLTGDRKAWDEFFDANYRTISSVVAWRRWGFTPAEAEDVTQDIFEAIIKSLKGFEFRSKLSTFVYKISVSICIARLRKRAALKRGSGRAELPIDPFMETMEIDTTTTRGGSLDNPEDLLIRRESIFAVGKALTGLNERCRELIRFRYFNELSFQEISEITGLKENSLVVQLKRCLARLFGILQAEGSHV
ncbi:MAG: sigma-70 family RNA polymerase sigma factor [Desulfomonile sp.]|nr:sigma-70 family RNA polymerase sigma factor [Desulfomonile sp.]